MARIELRLFESTAISKPSTVHKERASKTKGKKKTGGKYSRLTKQQFQELSTKEQSRYLTQFPKSSHRKLVGKKSKKDAEVKRREKKTPAKVETPKKEQKIKKLSREEFDKLPLKKQKEYKKAFPKNSFKGKKHHAIKKKNIVERNKTGKDGETTLTGHPDKKNSKKAEQKALKNSRDKAKSELRHSVTKESVDALKRSTPSDFKEAASNLKKNRLSNLRAIEDTLKSRPEHVSMSQQEINKVERDLKRKTDKDEPDLDDDTTKKAKDLISSVKPDKPVELTDEQRKVLEDVNDGKPSKKERFWQKDLKVLKGFITGEELEPDGRSNAMLMLGVVARYALIAGGISAIAMGAGPAGLHIAQSLFSQWDSFNTSASDGEEDSDEEQEENQELIGIAYDAVADYLQNVDHEEFVESIDSTFLEFRSKSSANPYFLSLILKDLELLEDCCQISDKGALILSDVERVMERLQPSLETAGFNRVNDVFYRGDDAVGIYSEGPSRSKVLSLPSPASITESFMEEV